MGAISFETAAGVDRYADLANTTRDVIMSGDNAIDQLYGTNAGNKDMALSGVLAEMLKNKKNIKMGLGMKGIGLDALPVMSPVDPFANQTVTDMPQLTKTHTIPSMATFYQPIVTYDAELLTQSSEAQVVSMLKTKMYAALLSGSIALIRNWYGNQTQYYSKEDDPTNAAVAGSFKSWSGDYNAFCGLGFGDSAVANCIMGKSNTYGGVDRTTSTNYAAKVYDGSALTIAADGVAAVTSWAGITLDHLDFLVEKSRVGMMRGSVITVPELGFRAIKSLFRAKQIQVQYDVALLKMGIQAIEFNGAKIICDYNFHHPKQIDCYNPEYTYIAFAEGRGPKISNAQPLWGKVNAVGQQFTFTAQAWSVYPGLHSRIYWA